MHSSCINNRFHAPSSAHIEETTQRYMQSTDWSHCRSKTTCLPAAVRRNTHLFTWGWKQVSKWCLSERNCIFSAVSQRVPETDRPWWSRGCRCGVRAPKHTAPHRNLGLTWFSLHQSWCMLLDKRSVVADFMSYSHYKLYFRIYY